MRPIEVDVDAQTKKALQRLSQMQGDAAKAIAAKLRARAVRAARPRLQYDIATLTTRYAEFADDDLALAEAASEERADLLSAEDAA